MQLAFIEDSDEDFASLSRVFQPYGSLARWSSGESALQALQTQDPRPEQLDVVLVDLHLPGIDGVEVVESLRALPGGDKPALCMLTTSQKQHDVERAMSAGADGFLTKPNDIRGLKQLPALVEELLQQRTAPS